MNTLTIAIFASMAALIAAAPGVSHVGSIVSGPSGVVTDHGPIGPVVGHGIPYYAGPAAVAVAPAVAYAAPIAKTVVAAPAWAYAAAPGLGYGAGLGHGGLGVAGLGHAGLGVAGYGGWGYDGGYAGAGHGLIGVTGVTVKGPATVPATIAGPSGKIVADGLWGPTLAGGHGGVHGHGW